MVTTVLFLAPVTHWWPVQGELCLHPTGAGMAPATFWPWDGIMIDGCMDKVFLDLSRSIWIWTNSVLSLQLCNVGLLLSFMAWFSSMPANSKGDCSWPNGTTWSEEWCPKHSVNTSQSRDVKRQHFVASALKGPVWMSWSHSGIKRRLFTDGESSPPPPSPAKKLTWTIFVSLRKDDLKDLRGTKIWNVQRLKLLVAQSCGESQTVLHSQLSKVVEKEVQV